MAEARIPIFRRLPAVRTLAALLAASAIGLSFGAGFAWAGAGTKIIEKCTHGEPFSGYSQSAYREALKNMPTEVSEYSDCANLIRKAELAAAGGGGSEPAGASAPNVALALTPSEQKAVQNAHVHGGAAPVQIGSRPVRPGVVHADIASAVNTLPHSLFAVLAFTLAGALALGGREVYQRVNARRHD